MVSLRGQDLFALDANLRAELDRRDPSLLGRWAETLGDFGRFVGDDVDRAAEYTDRHGHPTLQSHDRDGRLANHVVTNPAWQDVSRRVYEKGAVGLNYADDPAPYLVTFSMGYLLSQADTSLHCPVTMTGAVAYVLDRFAPESVKRDYLHQLTRMDGQAKSAGTWATEQHGGSDVGATTTVARQDGDAWRLSGIKWFTSAIDGGIAVATARPEDGEGGSRGLGLYLVPTEMPDGSPNDFRIRRLKDKLGTIGVPTAELDLTDTWALEIAAPPTGFRLMMEALEFSRIQNALGSSGLHRRAYLEALSFADGRSAFGNVITNYPMVQDELLKLLVTLDASVAMSMEAAAAFDAAHTHDVGDADSRERTWLRLATALAKYLTAEYANQAARGAIEIIGGNGYTYDYVTPRLLRDAQVLTVWEGPANIQALELLRLLSQRYGGAEMFAESVGGTILGAPEALSGILAPARAALRDAEEALRYVATDADKAQRHARRLMALLADLFAASLLTRQAAADLEKGDGRKACVLKLFVDSHLADLPRRGIGAETEWASKLFRPLADYEPVEPADLPH